MSQRRSLLLFSLAFLGAILAGVTTFLQYAQEELIPPPVKEMPADPVEERRTVEATQWLNESLLVMSEEGLDDNYVRKREDIVTDVSALVTVFEVTSNKDTKKRIDQGLKVLRSLYGKISKEAVGNWLNDLGCVMARVPVHEGKPAALYWEESIAILEEALVIRSELFGEDHVSVARTYGNIATILHANNKNKKRMKECGVRSYEILSRVLGENHEMTIAAKEDWVNN
jgi:hypothetical protein